MEKIIADPEKYSDGEVSYTTRPSMPHANEIKKRIHEIDQKNNRVYTELADLIRTETRLKKKVEAEPLFAVAESAELEKLEQEIPQRLNSCPYNVLVKLEKRFGAEVLGEYAPSSDYFKE